MRHFFRFFTEKFFKTPKQGSFFEKLQVLAKPMFFLFLHEMRHFLRLFPEKFVKTPKHGSFLEKLQFLAKSTIFRVFSRSEALFATFC